MEADTWEGKFNGPASPSTMRKKILRLGYILQRCRRVERQGERQERSTLREKGRENRRAQNNEALTVSDRQK